MARDPLPLVLAVRRRAVEQARYALAACLTVENAISDKITLIDAAGQRDRETCRAWQDAHWFMEMSARRQETLRAERCLAAEELAKAAASSAQARSDVVVARTAAETVQQLMDERAADRQVEAAKREQHVLDDIARTRAVGRRRGATR